jgi:hypothetical protein
MWLGFGGWLAFPSKAARLLTTTSWKSKLRD